MDRQTYTIKQFCTAFNMSRTKLYHLWKTGQGPAKKHCGGVVLITNTAAQEWLETLPNERAAA